MTSRKRSSDSQGLGADTATHTKKAKVGEVGTPTGKVDANGDCYWEISKQRRVTISSFRGKTLINVREYYEKDGQELPGKKGISMPVDQFAALVKLLPDIAQALEEQGESLPRPVYSGQTGQSNNASDEEHDSKAHQGANASKQNIEATSDEESEA